MPMGRPPKTTWPPCADCGTTGGAKNGTATTPVRLDGQRFGVDGQLCLRCYERRAQAERREERRAERRLVTLAQAVLAVRDALGRRDMAAANEHLRLAVELAEFAAPDTGE